MLKKTLAVGLLLVAAAVALAAGPGGVWYPKDVYSGNALDTGSRNRVCEVYAVSKEVRFSLWDYSGSWRRVWPDAGASAADTVVTVGRGTSFRVDTRGPWRLIYFHSGTDGTYNASDSTALWIGWE